MRVPGSNQHHPTDDTAFVVPDGSYRDYFLESATNVARTLPRPQKRGPRGGVVTPFPAKLYQMLQTVQDNNLEHVVSWEPHGRSFTIYNPEEFEKQVIPRFFNQTKLSSFRRQINLYGFRQQLTIMGNGMSFFHELFLRGRPDLAKLMPRSGAAKRNNSAGSAAAAAKKAAIKKERQSDEHPDFDAMPICCDITPMTCATAMKQEIMTMHHESSASVVSQDGGGSSNDSSAPETQSFEEDASLEDLASDHCHAPLVESTAAVVQDVPSLLATKDDLLDWNPCVDTLLSGEWAHDTTNTGTTSSDANLFSLDLLEDAHDLCQDLDLLVELPSCPQSNPAVHAPQVHRNSLFREDLQVNQQLLFSLDALIEADHCEKTILR